METVIVAINNKFACAYTFVEPDGDPLDAMARAEEFYQRNEPEALPIRAMTWDQFVAWEESKMQAKSEIRNSNAEDFMEQLCCLPPMGWTNDTNFERFTCSEPTHSTWHQQYARIGDRYLTKLVNIKDPSTWITKEHFK